MPEPTTKVLLSGGIGSGKSTLARFLNRLGAEVIDADEIGHVVLENEAHDPVLKAWPDVATSDGNIDRSKLAAIVFDDPAQLDRLEQITHPAIASRLLEAVESTSAALVIVELPVDRPLLGEEWVKVAVVGAPRESRVEWLIARGMAAHDVRARMTSQPSDEEWTVWAEVVVVNDGTPADLERAAERLVDLIDGGILSQGPHPIVVTGAS